MKPIRDWVGLPAMIVGALVAIGTLLGWLGFHILSPAEKLDLHITQERVYHVVSDSVIREVDTHAEDQEKLLEALIRGECLENPRVNLARQGLLRKCRELGVIPEEP